MKVQQTQERFGRFALGDVRSRLAIAALGLCLGIVPLKAQAPTTKSSPGALPAAGPTNPQELESFADTLLPAEMTKWHIPGVAFLVVKDGRVLFQKGYGYADLDKKVPVDPARTVFRVGSISKLFTATAVMQLAERGQVDLHTDVNHYLPNFQLPETFPEPVTLSNLLTHTGGFDDEVIGIAARTPEAVLPLGDYLAHSMPPRVAPPGTMYSYSSLGITLAGYIVQTVSGQPFADYVQRNILDPLQMSQSSFQLQRALSEKLARGYVVRDGVDQPVPYDYFNIRPAVSLSSTADDMAHFMIANLGGGVFGSHRILSEKTLGEMQSRQFAEDPRLPGRTYGFYERYRNGWRAIGHGGNVRGFGSLLLLVPEAHTGIFLAANVDEPRFDDDFFEKFFDRYFPERTDPEPPPPIARSMADVAKFAGRYRVNPYSESSLEKLASLNWQYRVVPLPDGALEIHIPHDYTPPGHWVERAPLYFERTDDQGRAVFLEDSRGHITSLVLGSEPHARLPWFEWAPFQVDLVKTLLLIFVSMPAVWLVEFVARRLLKRPAAPSWSKRTGRLLALTAGFSAIVLVVGFVRTVSHIDFWSFTYGIPAPIQRFLVLPPSTAVAACGMLVFDVRGWMKREGNLFDRLYFTLLTVAALAFVWFLIYWNLLKVS